VQAGGRQAAVQKGRVRERQVADAIVLLLLCFVGYTWGV